MKKVSLVSMVLAVCLNHVSAEQRPNLLVIVTDDQHYNAVGYRNPQIKTPNIDKEIAAKGVIFNRCYATSAICMPSRVNMMTGMYEFKTGVNFESGKVKKADWQSMSYPSLLQGAGYKIGFAGKLGLKTEGNVHLENFDDWAGWGGQGSYKTGDKSNGGMAELGYAEKYPHVTRAIGAFGRDFVKKYAKTGQPFCLNLWYKAPHSPQSYIDPIDEKKYSGVTFNPPANWGHEGKPGADHLPAQAKVSRQWSKGDSYAPKKYQETVRKYNQLIAGVDDSIKMVLDEIRAQGLDKNTLILFTSDNGYFGGAHAMGDKVLPYEEGSRVPLVIYDPRMNGKHASVRTKSIAANIDLAPTLLDAAGIEAPQRMDGMSLLPVVRNPKERVREDLLLIQNWGWAEDDFSRALAVVTESQKYIFWPYGDKNIEPAEELYDLDNDPFEVRNLSAEQSAKGKVAEMHKRYDKYLDIWRNQAVADPTWERMKIVFDRTIPWQKKPIRTGEGHNKYETLKKIYDQLSAEK